MGKGKVCCGLGSYGLTIGVNDLRSLFYPKQGLFFLFCDSKRGLDLQQRPPEFVPRNELRMALRSLLGDLNTSSCNWVT